MEFEKGPAKPFIKWAGGKTQSIDELWKNMHKKFNNFYEPFLGSGALFFNIWNNRTKLQILTTKKKRKFHLSDKNQYLINTYLVVQNNPDELIEELERYQKRVNKTEYLKIRKESFGDNSIEDAARFIYLNKTCYNGLYRVNKKGVFNVPWGARKNTNIYNLQDIKSANYALKHAKIINCDFEMALKSVQYGDFVYIDPPYFTDGFNHYTSDGFGANDHQRLANIAQKIVVDGGFVLHSNADDPFIKKIYSKKLFKHIHITSRRIINCDGTKRNPVSELLISSRELNGKKIG